MADEGPPKKSGDRSRSFSFLMTCLRTSVHEETELLTVVRFAFRAWTPRGILQFRNEGTVLFSIDAVPVTSTGATIDFLLSAKQDAAAAKLAVFAGNLLMKAATTGVLQRLNRPTASAAVATDGTREGNSFAVVQQILENKS